MDKGRLVPAWAGVLVALATAPVNPATVPVRGVRAWGVVVLAMALVNPVTVPVRVVVPAWVVAVPATAPVNPATVPVRVALATAPVNPATVPVTCSRNTNGQWRLLKLPAAPHPRLRWIEWLNASHLKS